MKTPLRKVTIPRGVNWLQARSPSHVRESLRDIKSIATSSELVGTADFPKSGAILILSRVSGTKGGAR